MAQLPKNPVVKVRTAKAGAGPSYVIVAGAPTHYVPGYGQVGPGAIVTLPEGTKPGRWLVEVNQKDVEKAQAEGKESELAEAAAPIAADAAAAAEEAEKKAAAEAASNTAAAEPEKGKGK